MKVDMNSNQGTVTVEGQITVELVSSLARLDLKICCYIYAVKQLKLETSRAVILPPTVSVLCSSEIQVAIYNFNRATCIRWKDSNGPRFKEFCPFKKIMLWVAGGLPHVENFRQDLSTGFIKFW